MLYVYLVISVICNGYITFRLLKDAWCLPRSSQQITSFIVGIPFYIMLGLTLALLVCSF
jgi:flagellar biosynthesis protein FliR